MEPQVRFAGMLSRDPSQNPGKIGTESSFNLFISLGLSQMIVAIINFFRFL